MSKDPGLSLFISKNIIGDGGCSNALGIPYIIVLLDIQYCLEL